MPPPLARGLSSQPQAAAGVGADVLAGTTEPFKRPNTSVTTSRIKVSFTALIYHLSNFAAVNLFAEDIHDINDADDNGVHRRFLQIRRESRGTALAKQNHF